MTGARQRRLVAEQVARIGKAVASPKRLELIELMCQGEKTVEVLAAQAEINVKLRRPAGCVVHPKVIHTIRHFWLACLRTNESLRPQDQVAPEAFLLRWLEQAEEPELTEFVATLPFWPMGMDEQGNWI